MRRWWKAKPAACQPTLMAGRQAHLAFQKYSKEAFIHYNAPALHLADQCRRLLKKGLTKIDQQ